ncbi:hypothetical protein F4780DRAFT_371664 [Xylariomycetidae sp. FL0641]|nr:hypothetical protein F4780DRAFT_371664 [Xylariomycetidae sp. FL0641]
MEYNLDELDTALSEARRHPATAAGPPTPASEIRRSRTAPATRRGSLVPALAPADSGRKKQYHLNELNLFNFDLKELVRDILLTNGESRVAYHEYAVFSPPDNGPNEDPRSTSIRDEGREGRRMFHQAVKHGHSLDNMGKFTASPKGKRSLQGRTRQVIADRRVTPSTPDQKCTHPNGGLEITVEDFEALGLHSATLPSLQRVTSESSFWDVRRETLYLVFSFSDNPQPPYDFLSMAYKLRTKTTTALVRRSLDTRWHDEDACDEYERRLDSCRARWAHPLVLPVVLLQVQLFRTEEAVVANNGDVQLLEAHVDAVTGTTGQANIEAFKKNMMGPKRQHSFKPLKRLSTLKGYVEEKVSKDHNRRKSSQEYTASSSPAASLYEPDYVPPQTIHLMKEAHNVLKGSIQLLDTLRWMERAVKLLIQIGDELALRLDEMNASAAAKGETSQEEQNDLSYDWHEIRQYLDCTWRLCTALETDRRMSELRCRAQIDIIYSKMAQEDNNLNARMAVASTRDSSSMKALAVITAIFLPGEYIGTLFGVSMFDWQHGTAGDDALSKDAPDGLPHPVIMPSFWIYWAFTIPLTLFIVAAWRAWWVNQDRYFRRHLSNDLSNERYWTTDGRPRDLETTFLQDFLSVFSRSGATSSTNRTVLGSRARESAINMDLNQGQSQCPHVQRPGLLGRGFTLSQTMNLGKDRDPTDSEDAGDLGRSVRFPQISFAMPRQRNATSVV